MPTFSPDSLLAVRYQQARPGLDLVAIVDAALPIAQLTAEVLAQDRKPLPLLEEFVLRLVGVSVHTEAAVAGVLGVPETMVTATVAKQLSDDFLKYAPTAGNAPSGHRPLMLTDRGQTAARDHASIRPVRVDQRLVYDLLLWKARPYDRQSVISRGQAEEEGMLLLPAAQSGPVELSDVSAPDINALLRERGRTDREVLQVRAVNQTKARRVFPVKILVYADAERTDIQLGVVVDGELSTPHELALLGRGGAAAMGITVESPPERPKLEPELEKIRIPLAEITHQRAEQAALQFAPMPAAPPVAEEQLAQEIRAIGVFEHPDVLDEALTQARRRILIISPWVKSAIITTDFLSKLERRLARGVTTTIAYGYEDNDLKSDAAAVRRLENLAARYSEKFSFVRLKSTHAKVLVFDDTWVTTSFNWLSFRGDPDRTYRMEEGSLVRNGELTTTMYERYLTTIDEQKR